MRILVLSINYWPEPTGIGAVTTRRCEHLASLGHEVTVCTGMPYYPEWQIHEAYRRKLFCGEKRNGVRILRSWLWVPEKVSSIKRVLFEASFLASSLLRALGTPQPQLVVMVSPPLGLALSARILSLWTGAPYVYDVQDLQPDAAADLGMLHGRVLPILYRLESMAYRRAALITTLTEGMRQRIVAKGIQEARVAVVPPPADNSLFSVGSADQGRAFRRRHNLEGKFVVGHSGNMGVKQGLDLLLDVAGELKHRREIVFLLTGDGVMKSCLEMRAEALCLNNVRFLPVQREAEFLNLLAAIDLALIVQKPNVSDIAFPSKTVTLLAAAKPVAASVNAESEVARVVARSGGGLRCQPGEPGDLADDVFRLFQDPAQRFAMGGQGRQYAQRHWHEALVLPEFASYLVRTAEGLERSKPAGELAEA